MAALTARFLDLLSEENPRAKSAKRADLVDNHFIKELDHSGNIDNLYKIKPHRRRAETRPAGRGRGSFWSSILVDKFRFQIDIARMLRRALSLLLVLSWFILAGVDVLEDLGPRSQVEFNSYIETGGLANDMVETADPPCLYSTGLSEQAVVQLSVFSPNSSPRTSKLHKLHHIYQI